MVKDSVPVNDVLSAQIPANGVQTPNPDVFPIKTKLHSKSGKVHALPQKKSDSPEAIVLKMEKLAARIAKRIPQDAGPKQTYAIFVKYYRDLQSIWDCCKLLPADLARTMELTLNVALDSCGHSVKVLSPGDVSLTYQGWMANVEGVLVIDPRADGATITGLVGLGHELKKDSVES